MSILNRRAAKSMNRTLILAAPLVALAFAAPASAQEKPASAAQIVEAIDACKAITAADWIDLKKLREMGWETYTKSNRGNALKVGGAYAKAGNAALIVAGKAELKDKTCVVLASLKSGADYGPTIQAVAQIIGMPNRQDQFTYYWDMDGQQLSVDPAGEKNSPKAHFAIVATKDASETETSE